MGREERFIVLLNWELLACLFPAIWAGPNIEWDGASFRLDSKLAQFRSVPAIVEDLCDEGGCDHPTTDCCTSFITTPQKCTFSSHIYSN